MAQWDGAQG